MIFGIGIDLVQISRVEAALERWGRRFVERCFQPAEAERCLGRPRPANALAMGLAAKEAFAKAAGLGMRGLGFKEIEVVHDIKGKPELTLHGRAAVWARAAEVAGMHLSLTDDGAYAAAVVVLEKS